MAEGRWAISGGDKDDDAGAVAVAASVAVRSTFPLPALSGGFSVAMPTRQRGDRMYGRSISPVNKRSNVNANSAPFMVPIAVVVEDDGAEVGIPPPMDNDRLRFFPVVVVEVGDDTLVAAVAATTANAS